MSVETASDPHQSLRPQAMGKMLENIRRGYYSWSGEAWTPAANLYERADVYLVCVDLAGVEKEKIDITVVKQKLVIRGHRPVPVCPQPECDDDKQRVRLHLMEIDHGPFSRVVDLPDDVVTEKIHASYRSGLLWIELPKSRT